MFHLSWANSPPPESMIVMGMTVVVCVYGLWIAKQKIQTNDVILRPSKRREVRDRLQHPFEGHASL